LAGTVRVVAMVYTSCHATCPLIVGDLKRIEASIPADRRDDVGFVLVSLDPARDTPARMAEWARRTRLDDTRWTLLNGDADAVREVAAALGVRYQPQTRPQANAELAHTNVVTVLDATGAPVHQQVGLGAAANGTIDAVQRLLR
ncbi:MAG: SCO family protein, partial [Gemmatirosa sp.]